MLHPDKTKILFFSNTCNGEGVQINCNNNNDDLLNPDLIKQLSPITSNDDIPAAKFLGVYFDPSPLNTKCPVLRKNSLEPYTCFEWLKKYFPPLALKWFITLYFTVTLYMPFKFGLVEHKN